MSSFDWEKVWTRHYNNSSDERWKIKSLNPMSPEEYKINLPKNVPSPPSKPGSPPANQDQGKGDPLPSPKITKINESMYCISLEQDLNLFYYQQPEDKAKKRSNKMFGKSEYRLGQKIESVTGFTSGQGENYILVGTADKLFLLKIVHENYEYVIKATESIASIPDLRTLVGFGVNRVVAVSGTSFYEYEVVNDKLKELVVRRIQFSKGDDEKFRALKPIGMVLGFGKSFYYFGSKTEVKVDESKLKGVPGEELVKGQCQSLTIVQMNIQTGEDISGVKGSVFPIDHIFELGLFNRTKIFEIEQQTFLFSLHEEIILIKKNFNKYIVWDNVSVVSSKGESKKGQLALAAQTIMVYSEKAEIFANEIFFSTEDTKLHMPTIDNFRGNDNDQQILYDALMLSTEDSIIKVLLYVKPQDVVYPNQSPFRQVETDPNKVKEVPTELGFTVICINQNDPLRKLEQLIEKKKPNQQIEDFCARFNISEQDLLKCKWNVSGKKQKDIESILMMMIKDDEFIQRELDNILKAESHNLQFLSIVQNKQGQRLRSLLAEKIAEFTKESNEGRKKGLRGYIFQILRWLMQSEMFSKKVKYSKNFLTFKEYDFIEIGKLRAASLKEEIKLLSCKKYQKRLKYFLNQFKTLVIANFEEVFNFLLMDKSVNEIEEFIWAFNFILPNFSEPSEVYILKGQYNIIEKKDLHPGRKRDRYMSFSPIAGGSAEQLPVIKVREPSKDRESKIQIRKDKSMVGDVNQQGRETDKCILWQDLKGGQIEQTMQVFLKKRIEQVRSQQYKSPEMREQAVANLQKLLAQFQGKSWFTTAAFKQHCMITKTSQEIIDEFNELKRKKAFKILIKFLYHEVQLLEKKGIKNGEGEGGGAAMQKQVDEMIDRFIGERLIPQSFKRNVDARVRVYKQLLKPLANRKPDKKTIAIELPELQEFVVKSEPEYFQQIFSHIRNLILTKVKQIYDELEMGFFRERFQLFLKSDLVTPQDVISFLDQFNEQIQADQIRLQVFSAIKRLLKLTDQVNTRKYIEKTLDKQILPEREDAQKKLKDQAKIPYAFYFYHLFVAFNLDYTYQQLIGFSNQNVITNNTIILELVRKYCGDEFRTSVDYEGTKTECKIYFEEYLWISDRLPDTDIFGEPLQFFGLLLIFLDMLDFLTGQSEVFELMMQNYLNRGRFKQLSEFIMKLKNYHITEHNMNTKNYQMISDFKEEVDIDGKFVEYTLEWVKRNYETITSLELLQEKMKLIDRSLNMLQVFNKNSQPIKKERALFVILSYLMKFQPSIAMNVQDVKDEAVNNGSFMFMMHMFNKIGIDKLIGVGEETDVVQYLFRIFQSHQEHVLSQKVDYFHADFIRFLIEMCIRTIERNYFRMAKYLMLYKIPNDNEYFRDVLLLFLAAGRREDGSAASYSTDIVKLILTPQTTSLIRNNLQSMIDKYKIRSFYPLKAEGVSAMEKSGLKMENKSDFKSESKIYDQRPEQKLQFHKNICDIFRLTMSKYRKSDAFFLLVRARIVRNDTLKKVASGFFSSYTDSYDQERLNIEFQAYLLTTSYLKVLQMFIEKQFYPTFGFYESKMLLLMDPKERKDIVKDINIALSKLERMFSRSDKNKTLFDLKNELEQYYVEYMRSVGEDPDIKLVDPETKGTTATVKAEIFARKKEDMKEQEEIKNEVNEYKKAIQENINRTHQVQQDSRLNVLNRQVNQYITEIRKGNERHAMLEADIKKQVPEMNLAEKKAKEFEEIKKKEKEDIESIKDTYKSNTTKRVTDLIENLRKRREEIKAKTYAPTSPVRDEGKGMNTFAPSGVPARNRVTFGQPPIAEEAESTSPLGMIPKVDRRFEALKSQDKGGNRFVDLQKKMFPQVSPMQPVSFKKKANFQDVANIYRERESPQALQCIQKYDMLKNAPVRMQLIKRAYAVTANLDSFLQFAKFLIDLDPTWKEAIEEKSIPIVTQMLKMEPKQKVTIKQIVPAELFTKVTNITMKDYYPMVFELFKPSLRKIFEKDLMPVHAVGILFRYALGSENKFYGKVFYQYFSTVLKAYQMKTYDEKELTLLAQKIRSNYSSLPDSKDQVLQQLLLKIANVSKRQRLLQSLRKIIDRKGESLVGGPANKQINYVVQKLMKA